MVDQLNSMFELTDNLLPCSCRLAAARAPESASAQPLVNDPYASALAALPQCTAYQEQQQQQAQQDRLADAVSSAYLDALALETAGVVNIELNGAEYKQVVLLGDGLDTRPHRLDWPKGTVLFCVAPTEAHKAAEAALQAAGAKVPGGCLLRRVRVDVAGLARESDGDQLAAALDRAGYRADRLSVWLLQGLECAAPTLPTLRNLLTSVANAAAFGSVVCGCLPPGLGRRVAENLLAEFSMLGTVAGWKEIAVELGAGDRVAASAAQDADIAAGLPPAAAAAGAAGTGATESGDGRGLGEGVSLAGRQGDGDGGHRPGWLFGAQHRAMSLLQMGIYDDHVAAAQDADEDYFDNIS